MLYGKKGIACLISCLFFNLLLNATCYSKGGQGPQPNRATALNSKQEVAEMVHPVEYSTVEMKRVTPENPPEIDVEKFNSRYYFNRETLKKFLDKKNTDNFSSNLFPGIETDPINPPSDHKVIGRLFYFLSSSMPETSLKQAVSQGEKLRITYVMRGLLMDKGKPSFLKTAQFIYNVIKDNNILFLIDPFLFQEYDIKSVPYLVYTENNRSTCPTCEKLGNDEQFIKIGGNITIKYALEKITEKKPSAEFFLKLLKNENSK